MIQGMNAPKPHEMDLPAGGRLPDVSMALWMSRNTGQGRVFEMSSTGELFDLDLSGIAPGQQLSWNGTALVPVTEPSPSQRRSDASEPAKACSVP